MVVGPGTARTSLGRAAGAIFLVLVAVNAAVGITALVVGEFGQTQGKVLGTSLLATAGCVGVLVNVPAMRSGRAGPVPAVASGLALVTAGLLTAGMWAGFEGEVFGKLASSSALLTIAGTYAGLMSLLPVRGRQRALQAAAYVLVALGTAALLTFIWLDVDNAAAIRVVGVGAVLLAADTLALPVLVRQSRPAALPVWYCPRCRREVPVADAGERAACAECGVEFAVFEGRRDAGGADGPADPGQQPPVRAAV